MALALLRKPSTLAPIVVGPIIMPMQLSEMVAVNSSDEEMLPLIQHPECKHGKPKRSPQLFET